MGETFKIGLIAGRGNLPFEVLQEIRSLGHKSVVVGLAGEADSKIAALAGEFQEIAAPQLGAIIDFLKAGEIKELVMAGKVGKEALFKGGFDQRFQNLLAKLTVKNDDAILLALVQEFEESGLPVAKQTDYLRSLLVEPGVILGDISERERADVDLGFRVAKAMGGLDIGQSVVVKHGVVLAVEAIEGTDQAIIRGGALGGNGAVVVKVSKPAQDERFDVPTIGKSTILSMITAGATVLGIEAGKTLLTEREELLAEATAHGIKIIAVQHTF